MSAAPTAAGWRRPPPRRRDLALRRILRGISNRGKVLGKIRASLLGLERIVPFVSAACDGLGLPEDGRFETIRRDIESLDEFETRLAENVQFLLDAALGLINIEQNNVFRVLTVVSVVGVPPTLIASMYGMNFKHMPELDWAYGYPYALGLILFSAIVPIVVFRIKGWFWAAVRRHRAARPRRGSSRGRRRGFRRSRPW